MTARANWFQDLDSSSPEVDPFASPVLEAVPPIDLTTAEPRLERIQAELLRSERILFDQGVACGLKELPDSTCLACPLYGRDERMKPLCSIGREQERVTTVLAAKLHGS